MTRVRFKTPFRQHKAGDVADVEYDPGLIATLETYGRLERIMDEPLATDPAPAAFSDVPPDNKAINPEQVKRKRGRPRKVPI